MALEQALMFTSTWDAASATSSDSHRHVLKNIVMRRGVCSIELSSNHPLRVPRVS